MSTWTPEQWQNFLLSLGGFLTVVAGLATTIILQIRNGAKVDAAKAISTDTNEKTTAIVRQTNELARADPNASSAPTDMIAQRGPASERAPQRVTDPT